jgi:hypothetical protein
LTLILQLVEENEIVSRTGDLVDYWVSKFSVSRFGD